MIDVSMLIDDINLVRKFRRNLKSMIEIRMKQPANPRMPKLFGFFTERQQIQDYMFSFDNYFSILAKKYPKEFRLTVEGQRRLTQHAYRAIRKKGFVGIDLLACTIVVPVRQKRFPNATGWKLSLICGGPETPEFILDALPTSLRHTIEALNC